MAATGAHILGADRPTTRGSIYAEGMTDKVLPAAAAGTVRIGDFTVNRMGFGALHITGPQHWGEPADREGAKRLVRRAYELGVNFIDTADSYGPHVSEQVIRDALHPYPPDLLICTKGGKVRPTAEPWLVNGRP